MVDYKQNCIKNQDIYRNNTVQEQIVFGEKNKPLNNHGLEKKILVEFACVFD